MSTITAVRPIHQGWTTLSKLTIRLTSGEEITREVEDHGAAVAVLPYDPERRVALLVKLLRAPVLYKTGAPTMLEIPAGLIEDEAAEASARREVMEEVGVRLGALEHVARVWTMPGVSTERMDLYLGRYADADRIGEGGGVASENENITVVEIGLPQLWQMAEQGELSDHKALTLLLALRLRQPHLFDG